jgi:hypothetical protein
VKKLTVFIFSSLIFLSVAASSFAADKPILDCGDTTNQFRALCLFSFNSFGSIIGQVLNLIFVISIVVALLYLVWGGFKWLTSGGDKTAVGAAREHIIAAIVGLVIIFLSYFILNIIVGFFVKGADLNQLRLPVLNYCSESANCKNPDYPTCHNNKCCKFVNTAGWNCL